MINRENYLLVKEYMTYLQEVKQLEKSSIQIKWGFARHLLEYADSRHFTELEKARPTLPDYLNKLGIMVNSQDATLAYTRLLYAWGRMTKVKEFAKVSPAWVDTLRVKKLTANAGKEKGDHIFWKFDDILKIAAHHPEDMTEERTQAATCFLYLSGMRITAFSSLPLDCVDIQAGRIEQKPSKGVITKNRKSAVTFLLPIPELLKIVTAWDAKIRKAGAKHWYPTFKETEAGWIIAPNFEGTVDSRSANFRISLALLCKKVGVPALSPHKLRHGHAVYGVRHSVNIEQFKAVSQNLMHANMDITDGLYGMLPEENIKTALASFGKSSQPAAQTDENTSPELMELVRMLLAQMKKNSVP